jgi:hypothetical protein
MDRNSIKSQLHLLKQRLLDPNHPLTSSDLQLLQGLIDQLSINEELSSSLSPSSSITVPSITDISSNSSIGHDSSLTTADPSSSGIITPNQEHASISALTATSSSSISMNFANTSNINGSVSYLMTSIGGGMQGNFPFVWNPNPNNNSLLTPIVITNNPSNYITTTNVDFQKTRLAVDGDISTNGTLKLTPGSGGIIFSNPSGVKFDGQWGTLQFQGGNANNAWVVASSTGGPALFQVYNQTGNVDIKGYATGPNMCKAFVSFDGTMYVPNDNYCFMHNQYNVENVVRLGEGKYVVNFANSFDDAYYTPVVSVMKNDSNDDGNMMITLGCNGRAPTKSSCPITIVYRDLSGQDANKVTMIVYRSPGKGCYMSRVSVKEFSVTGTSESITARCQLAYFNGNSVECQIQVSGMTPISSEGFPLIIMDGPLNGEVRQYSQSIKRSIYPNINSSSVFILTVTHSDGIVQTFTTEPKMS